jgi:hypothetical protein
MSEAPPPLPASPPPASKPSMMGAWLSWIAACTLLPALPFLVLGKKALDGSGSLVFVLFAMAAQLGCSIWVPVILAKRSHRGTGFIIGLSIGLMAASVAVGTASFFGACLAADPSFNMH